MKVFDKRRFAFGTGGSALVLIAVLFCEMPARADDARVVPAFQSDSAQATGTSEVAVLAGGCFCVPAREGRDERRLGLRGRRQKDGGL